MATDEELHRKASALFGKLGAGLRSAGKQVTGIGRGTVRLTLGNVRAAPGGELAGTVALELPEPIDAKELRVTLKASQRTISYRVVNGVRSATTSTGDVYRFDLRLGGAQRYASGAHSFTLTVPPDALDLRVSPGTGGGALGDLARTVASVVAPTAGPIQWQVIAVLDIAWGKNLTHAVDVAITR
jgi:hypothetical protein